MWFGCSAPMQLGKISQMLEIEVVSLFRSPLVKSEKLSLTNEKTLFSKSIYSMYTRISLGLFTEKKNEKFVSCLVKEASLNHSCCLVASCQMRRL